jgi:hypothetical protein
VWVRDSESQQLIQSGYSSDGKGALPVVESVNWCSAVAPHVKVPYIAGLNSGLRE